MLTEFDLCEIWEDIPEYEGIYQCSSYGRVRTITNEGKFKPKLLKLNIDSDGYQVVALTKNKKAVTKKVHRLVGITFIDNLHNLPQINHGDGVKRNNYRYNLAWSSVRDNLLHAHRTGLKHGKSPLQVTCLEKVHLKKRKKVYKYTLDRVYITKYDSVKSAATKNNLNESNISCCCLNRSHSCGNYFWSYKEL